VRKLIIALKGKGIAEMVKQNAVILEAGTVSRRDLSFSTLDEICGGLTVFDFTPKEKIIEYIGDSEIVFCNKTPFSADIIHALPKLRYIGICATGYNNVDTAAANKQGITVTNVPGYATAAVAEMVFAYILEFSKRTAAYSDFVSTGGWQRAQSFAEFVFPMTEIAGKTIGIIGYGTIGRAVAKIASAFGMRVIVYTRTPKAADKTEVEFVSLEKLFSESDFITAHCPLTPETDKLINADLLKLCKPTAVIINTARGGVVDENALADALKSGHIAGAAVDVLTTEPMSEDTPLKNADIKNLIITPHVAWAPFETRVRLLQTVEENVRQYLNNTPVNTVN
jgi:glycerate dehydrogenase